jgi:hypothetical protein
VKRIGFDAAILIAFAYGSELYHAGVRRCSFQAESKYQIAMKSTMVHSAPPAQPAGFLQAQMALFGGDTRKLENAELKENKKRTFKGLDESNFADLGANYSTLK